MKYFRPEKRVVTCNCCQKALREKETRFLISVQRWGEDGSGSTTPSLYDSRMLCEGCYNGYQAILNSHINKFNDQKKGLMDR